MVALSDYEATQKPSERLCLTGEEGPDSSLC